MATACSTVDLMEDLVGLLRANTLEIRQGKATPEERSIIDEVAEGLSSDLMCKIHFGCEGPVTEVIHDGCHP